MLTDKIYTDVDIHPTSLRTTKHQLVKALGDHFQRCNKFWDATNFIGDDGSICAGLMLSEVKILRLGGLPLLRGRYWFKFSFQKDWTSRLQLKSSTIRLGHLTWEKPATRLELKFYENGWTLTDDSQNIWFRNIFSTLLRLPSGSFQKPARGEHQRNSKERALGHTCSFRGVLSKPTFSLICCTKPKSICQFKSNR